MAVDAGEGFTSCNFIYSYEILPFAAIFKVMSFLMIKVIKVSVFPWTAGEMLVDLNKNLWAYVKPKNRRVPLKWDTRRLAYIWECDV